MDPTRLRLPNSAMPSEPATSRDNPDPMAHLAADLLVSRDSTLSPTRAQALLAFASAHAFDPNALVTLPYGAYQRLPLATLLLSRMPGSSGESTPALPAWPERLEGFSPHLLRPAPTTAVSENQEGDTAPPVPAPVDGQWLVAALLAAGADPWRADVPWGGLDPQAPIHWAMARGLPRLVERMMAMPGAPGYAALAAHELDAQSHTRIGGKGPTWLHLASSSPNVLPCLEVLLAHGVRPDAHPPHPLEGALPGAVHVYARHQALPDDPALRRRIESAWVARAKSHDLTHAQLVSMKSALQGRPVDDAQALSDQMALVLATPAWGKERYPSDETTVANLGLDALNARARVDRGHWSGQWSGLAARLASRLRVAGEGHGVGGFSLANLIERQFEATPGSSTGRWRSADLAALPGALAPAIGFDWRPGVPIDGLVGLLLLSRSPAGAGRKIEPLPDLDRRLKDEAGVLGVADIRTWASNHAAAAVAFTAATIRKSSFNASVALIRAWKTALAAHPDYFAHAPELSLELFGALHAHFHISPLPLEGLALRLEPWMGPWIQAGNRLASRTPAPSASGLDARQRTLLIEFGLACDKPAWVAQAIEAGPVPDAAIARIQAWNASPKQGLTGMQAAVRVVVQARLEDVLPEAAPGRPGPRL